MPRNPAHHVRRFRPSSRRAGILAILALTCALVGAAPRAGAQQALRGFSRSLGQGDGTVDLLADMAAYDLDGRWATFTGNVVIRAYGQELRADRIRFNTETYQAIADGRVTLIGPDGSIWSGDALDVNLREETGTADDVAVYYRPFRIDAARGRIAEGVYVAENVVMSTCTNAVEHFHYRIAARRLRLRPGDDLTAHHAVGYVFGVPFFYLPYYWKDLKRHYGLRFEPGYRSLWGAYLLSSYKARVYRDADNRWIDSRTSLDVRSRRGLAYGQRFNWYLQELGDGLASVYFIDDAEDPLPHGVEDKNRYRFRVNHDVALSPRDRLLLQGYYVSDDQVMREFFEQENAQMRQPDNFLSYTHTGRHAAFGIIGRVRLNDFYTQVERLPEAWLNLNQREIGATGFYYESRHAAAVLQRQFDERLMPVHERYDAVRLDTWHAINLPLKLGGFLTLVPRVAYRGTSYSKTVETWESTMPVTTVTTNELGVVTSVTETRTIAATREGGETFRHVIEVGTETSFKAYGVWTADDGTTWRHIVEPYANYTYIPAPNVRPTELYSFDAIDTIDFTHLMRLGLRQRWQYKRGNRGHEVAMVDVYGDMLLEPEDHQDALDRIYLDSEFRPRLWMRWDFDAEYSLSAAQLETSSTRLRLWHDRFSSAAEYRYRADRSGLVLGSLTWAMSPDWTVNAFGRYDFETALMEEVGGYLQRNYDCIAFRLSGSVLPGYTRTDGTTTKDDYRVSFVAWLTHFPPDSVLESHAR